MGNAGTGTHLRDCASPSHWMDLDGVNIIQSRGKENTDWEQKDFLCVFVFFLSTPDLVSRDLCSLSLQEKSPDLYFAHNHAG